MKLIETPELMHGLTICIKDIIFVGIGKAEKVSKEKFMELEDNK